MNLETQKKIMNLETQNVQCPEQCQYMAEHQSQFGLSQVQRDGASDEPGVCQPKSLICIAQTILWDSKQHRLADSRKQKKTIYYVEPLRTPQGDLDLKRLVLGILVPKPRMCQ